MKIYLLVLSIAFSVSTFCQSKWTEINVPYQGKSSFGKIAIPDANSVWASFGNYDIDSFAVSSNAGATWTIGTIGAGTSSSITNLMPLSATTCYATILNYKDPPKQGIFKTTNGGLTWQRIGLGSIYTSPYSFPDFTHFWNANQGVTVGDGLSETGNFEIYTTSDGGVSWQRVPLANLPPVGTPNPPYSITNGYRVADNRIWFFGDDNGTRKIYRSDDFGISWKSYPVPFSNINLFTFTDSLHGYAIDKVAGLNMLFASTDGGAIWSTGIPYTGPQAIYLLTNIPGTSNIVVAGEGTSYSNNNGITWIPIDSALHGPTTFLSTSIGWSAKFPTGIYKWSNFQNGIAESTTTVSTNISGTDTTFISDGFFKIAGLKPIDGPNALNGNITSIVTIDPTVSSFDMKPYVQRHYDINPSINPTTSQAIVVLYFTQQEFDNYNEYVTTNGLAYPLLPSGGINNGNVRISQLHGSFTVTPDPENYGTDRILITPGVSWDPINKWWTLTFPVNGFSGFFVTTGNTVLPITLIKFIGSMSQGKVALQWITENETTTNDFVIERSNNGTNFKNIGKVPALSTNGKNIYSFEDVNPYNGNNFYRLRMTDKDMRSSYSSIITIQSSLLLSTQLIIYPNPAKSILNLKFSLNKKTRIYTKIIDASGRVIEKITIETKAGTNITPIKIEKLNKGIYYLETEIDGLKERMSFFKN